MVQLFMINVCGQVQGVGFRYFSKIHADRLGVSGFAENRSDNSLYIEAEGEAETLKEFLKQIRNGPAGSWVREVTVALGHVKNYNGFEIY